MIFATGLIVFNATKLDFDHLLVGDSSIAAISILAGMCAILLLSIFLVSKKIASKVRK